MRRESAGIPMGPAAVRGYLLGWTSVVVAVAVGSIIRTLDHHTPCDPDVPCFPDLSPHTAAALAGLFTILLAGPVIAMIAHMPYPWLFALPGLLACWGTWWAPATAAISMTHLVELGLGYPLAQGVIAALAARSVNRTVDRGEPAGSPPTNAS